MAATWPMAGAPRTIMSRIAWAASAAVRHAVLLEDVRQLALVDDVEDARRLAERGPEAGRRRGDDRARPPAPPIATELGSRIAPAASADARWRTWAAPTTVAAPWNSSPANWRKKRRRPRSAPSAGRRRRAGVVGGLRVGGSGVGRIVGSANRVAASSGSVST